MATEVDDGVTNTAALDFFVLSARLVAVTVTFVFAETVGAVNMPPLEMEPALVVQFTAVLLVPVTLAPNCFVPPDTTFAVVGETVTAMVVPVVTDTVALAFLVVSAALVAVTVTLVLLVTEGAVKRPAVEIVPALADQETAVFVVPETVALNCFVCPAESVAPVGLRETVIPELPEL